MKVALFFMHGSGGNGRELRNFLESFPIESLGYRSFRQVCDEMDWQIFTPTSSVRPYTAVFGEEMNIWFDRSLDWQKLGIDDPYEDVEGLQNSGDFILKGLDSVIDDFEIAVLGGFSMGGGLALNMLHRADLPDKVAGVFSMGSFVTMHSQLLTEDLSERTKRTPILMMHGSADAMIPIDWAEKTASSLLLKGSEVQFRKYDGVDHEIDGEELHDLTYWLKDIIQTKVRKEEEIQKGGKNAVDAEGDSMMDPSAAESTANGPTAAPVNMREMPREVLPSASLGEDESPVPYRITREGVTDTYIVDFEVPAPLVGVVMARDVLCCGSVFELSASPDGKGVRTQIISANPGSTCREIGVRLIKRLNDDPNNPVNPCPMS